MDSISKKNKRRSGFRSYINENYQERAVDVPVEPCEDKAEPFLFSEEVIIAVAQNVHKLSPLKNSTVGILGTLFVTNFKVSFITASLPVDTKESDLVHGCLQSDFLGLHDISLTEIDSLYSLSEGSKKKRLTLSTLPNKIQDLLIVLKNFRNVIFNFRLTPMRQDIKAISALLTHWHPKKIDLFYLALDTPPPKTGIPEFRFTFEWERELSRTRSRNWRVCKHNENHKPFASLPQTFVVPHGITDNDLANAAHHFKGNRPPVWCWGTPIGTALVRMPQLSPNITSNSSIENGLIKCIHKSHSLKAPQPTIIDLDRELPSLKSIQASFVKIKDLHTPDSIAAFAESEKNYLSRWQSSGWLSHIKQCLETAQRAAGAINTQNSSVILQENEARDLSCVISSLVQIILDPYARTLRGFHTLIQKDWIALGHPFTLRLGHLRQNNDERCPLWILFLDCVHQIDLHYPSALEYSSDYLMALFHSSYCSLHSSFMFDSPREELSTYCYLRDDLGSNCYYFWPIWTWWIRSESPLMAAVRKGCRCEGVNNSLEKNVPSNGANQSPIIQNSGKSFERESVIENGYTLSLEKEKRLKLREKFINVLYVQCLLRPLLSSQELSRIADPLTNSHIRLQRLIHLIGNADSLLPYDLSQTPPSLENEKEPSLPITKNWLVKPWVKCFSRWMPDPSPQMSQGERQRPTLEPCVSSYQEHWKYVRDIVLVLQKHIDPNVITQNGASS